MTLARNGHATPQWQAELGKRNSPPSDGTRITSHKQSGIAIHSTSLRLKAMQVGVALLVAGTMFLTARTSLSAQPTSTSLETLRPDYRGISPDGTQGAGLDNLLGFDPLMLVAYSHLVQILPNGKLAPDLATWSISKNQRVYTFTIRSNARFSNGHYVRARDAVFSIRRMLTPGLACLANCFDLIRGASEFAAGTTKTLSGVKVLGKNTLQITLIRPAAHFLDILAQAGVIYDQAVLEGKPAGSQAHQFEDNYLTNTCSGNQGSGPFRFVCHDRSSTIHSFYSGHIPKYTLIPNPYFYGRKPHIRLEVRSVGRGKKGETGLDKYRAYLAGTRDMTPLPAQYLNAWRGKSTQYHQFGAGIVTYLTPNVHLAPFDNVHCRLALAYAIDRNTAIKTVGGGLGRPTYAIVPKGVLGYYPGKDNPHYDLRRTRTELARCSSRTTPVDLICPDSANLNEGHFVVRGLAAAGFNISLKVISQDDWYAILNQPFGASKVQLVWNAWSQDYPDPQDFCTILLHSGSSYNLGGWSNHLYDRLVDKADATVSRAQRARLYIQAQHIALTQGAWITLSNAFGFELIKPYVHGLVGTEALQYPVPKSGDWANVTVRKHSSGGYQ